MKVLSFAPYQNWDVHHQLDLTLLRALRLRGVDTVLVTCDGTLLAGACYAVTINPDGWLQECHKCGQKGRAEGATAAGRHVTLGDSLTPEDYDKVDAWMKTVVRESNFDITYGEWNIGDWVLGTVHTHLKSVTEQTDRFRSLFHRYCRSGALCAIAMDRILCHEKPDHLVLFGARDSPYRITYELARSKDIKVLYHERGYVDDSFVLAENETIFEKAFKFTPPLAEWMAMPLTRAQCEFTRNYFMLREEGRGMNWPAYLKKATEPSSVWSHLGMPPEASVCALFTSTPYELEAFGRVPSSSQRAFMQNIIDVFTTRNQWLVIRVHPNTAGGTTDSTDLDSIQYFATMQREAPPNVVIIMPDEEFNSYALLYVAQVVLAPFSSVAYEGAGRGVPSAVMGSWMTLACVGTLAQINVESLRLLLDDLSGREIGNAQILRLAYRFTYLFTSRVGSKFGSFGMRNNHGAEKRFATDADLVVGHDPVLDRLCDHITKGGPLYEPMPPQTEEDENDFFAEESARLQQERRALREVIRRKVAMHLGNRVTLISLGGARPASRPIPDAVEIALGADWRTELAVVLKKATTPYVAFRNSRIEHLDRFHSSLLEALQLNPSRGARHGVWLTNDLGVICGEALSERTRSQWQADAIWQSCDAWSLLCLGVYRVTVFAEWLDLHADDGPEAFAVAAKEWLLSDDIVAPARPMAVYYRDKP
ncbi:MAG: glycosyl transferase, group 1 [Verrucomicrobiaceae bacterium]|nr:glycosyl transferase, group 1 [Verrucomicrobiaceae bacterium]